MSHTPILNLDVRFQTNEQGSSADVSAHNDSDLGASEATIQDESENFCELGITGAASAFELSGIKENGNASANERSGIEENGIPLLMK